MATVTAPVAAGARTPERPRRSNPIKQGEGRFGFAMIGLAVLFVTVFTAIPIVASLVLSFFSWDVISPPEFIGMENYRRLLDDGPVLRSFGVTIGMAIAIVVLQLSVGLGLAVLVNARAQVWLRTFFRTAFYLPLLASSASVSIFMGYLFDYKFGVVNYYLGLVGISNVPWLTSGFGAATTIVLITVWQQTGFTFVLFVAALMAVPTDVLEASQIDGAGGWRTFVGIKVPLISPTILFAAVVALINAMQLFDQPYIMTKGGPGTSTTTVTISMYQQGFQNLQFGYGSAIAIILLLLILAITGLQFLAARKLVFYQ
ncbi:carbohydrate ABC transporter permease [Microlunatus flavus]|uniref:Multiple sugar transport system permease protein n=1 Tax=Microlunatus flavus TaxID=1036181 RepID=A0A1H9A6B9_9ACTN|nr:sugar ABC transporter permease [Microlunatus flavus]SEP72033.1 multiple sugar transport system permease protein [Microlunatus flavus]